MKNITQVVKLILICIAPFISGVTSAGSPIFTLMPLTPTTIQLLSTETATVQYLVQNQSKRPHTLMMVPIPGINQLTTTGNCPNPVVLEMKQSCILTLQVNGGQMTNDIHDGPIVCQQGANGSPSPFLCNRPSASNILNITVIPVAQFTVTSSADLNGTVSPSGSQEVNSGANLLFTASPNANYTVYQWLVDGTVAQTGGATFLLANITANHVISVTFTNSSLFYSGAQNGQIYYSFDHGLTWSATAQTAGAGSPINSVFVTTDTLYAGAANSFVYYTTNNGSTWSNTSSPDGSGVNSIFASNDILYAGTVNGFVYYSSNNGSTWSITSSPDGSSVNGVFVIDNAMYAGTANGNVYYSINDGSTWTPINGQPDGSAIKSIFVSNNTLFVGTADEYAYSSADLTGGGSWSPFAQTVYSLFVNPIDNTMYAGTQGGYVFSISTGDELGFITYSLINCVYVVN